jgi:serine/threonine protein phosphatase PrpC
MQVNVFTTNGVRDHNEDTVYYHEFNDKGMSLYIIADGLGGHADGKKASDLACKTIAQIIETEDPASFVLGGYRLSEGELYQAFLSDAVRQTSAVVKQAARQAGNDMGTTLLVVLIKDDRGYCAHVGDCALFISLNSEDTLTKITTEHRRGPNLTRSIGAQDQVTPDVFSFTFREDSSFLMCSDGLWEVLSAVELNHFVHDFPIFCISEQLCQAALQAGSQDNITVLVVEGEGFIRNTAKRQVTYYTKFLSQQSDTSEKKAQSEKLEIFRTANLQPVEGSPDRMVTEGESKRELAEKSALIESLTLELETLQKRQKDFDQILQERDHLNQELARVKQDNQDLLEQDETLTHKARENENQLNEKVTSQGNRIHELESLVSRLQETSINLTEKSATEIDQLQKKISNLNDVLKLQKAEQERMVSTIPAPSTNQDLDKREIEKLRQIMQQQEQKIDSLITQIAPATPTIENLTQNQVNELIRQLDYSQKKINILNGTIESQKKQVEILSSESEKLQVIRQERNEQERKISEFQSKLNAYGKMRDLLVQIWEANPVENSRIMSRAVYERIKNINL